MSATAMRLPPLPTVRDLVKLYRITARKQLSQNFIMNERLTSKIVKQAGRLKDSQVIEVGPGPGGLTRSIIRKMPKRLVIVEKDRRFGPTLEMLGEAYASVGGKIDIVYDDILRTSIGTMIDEDARREWNDICPNINIIGNLPFSVSTHLIIVWLQAISEHSGPWSFGRARMVLTFQKEVAKRLVAPIKDKQRCRLSVMAQAWTIPRLCFLIPGKAFVPPPEVDVGVVTFVPLKTPKTEHDFKFFEKVTRHVFSFRRKFSIKGIATLFPPEYRDELSMMMFKLSDLDPQTRPYELSVEDINRLCSSYKYLLEKHPEIRHYNYRASSKILSKKYLRSVEIEEIENYLEDDVENDDHDDEEKVEPPIINYLPETASTSGSEIK